MTDSNVINDELPEGWTTAPVTELCELVRGVSYAKGEESNAPRTGYIPLLRAGNINSEIVFDDLRFVPPQNVTSEQMLRLGDVLVAMSSGSKTVVGKAATLNHEWNGTFGAFCGVLRPSTLLSSDYFGLFFQTKQYRDFVSEASAGVNINNLKREHFEQIPLPIPPIIEQKRIANQTRGLLTRVNAARDHLSRVPAILKRFRQAVLAAACSGRLTEDWREKHPHVEPANAVLHRALKNSGQVEASLDSSELSELPERWVWTRFVNLLSELRNGISTKPEMNPPGVPILRISSVRSGSVVLNDHRFLPNCNELLSVYSLRDGDLLFTRYNGSLDLLGVCGMVRGLGSASMVYPDKLMRVRFDGDHVLPSYAELFFQSSGARDRLTLLSRSSAGQQGVSGADIKAQPFALPPVEEQQEILNCVSPLLALADSIEDHRKKAMALTEKLTQSILAKAFRGELVPTEAELARREGREYEPASVLLERVKKQRESEVAKSSPPKHRHAKA